MRSLSGSHGSQKGGRYIIDDPRSIFYIPADKKVVVYFEWDGPLGTHHVEGFWKNPEGKAVVFSDFNFEAKQSRMAAFWELDLTESMTPGMWALEARIDGESAGTHTFQITVAPKPASSEPVRHMLEPAEIYKLASDATATIEKLGPTGVRQSSGSGFFVTEGTLVTAFQLIDGAGKVRVTFPDGHRTETDQVLAYDRLQDWAILKVTGSALSKLVRAPAGSWSVGDRCFTLNTPTEGNRVLIDESITGSHTFPVVGDRLNLANLEAASAVGSPLVNEYGELIGILGGSLFPGIPSRGGFMGTQTVAQLREGSLATPISLVPTPEAGAPARSLAQLQQAGDFTPSIVEQPELMYGTISAAVAHKKGEIAFSKDSKTEFNRQDPRCSVLLVWNPKAKAKGEIKLEIYDIYGHLVIQSKPSAVDLRPGHLLSSSWNLDLSVLKNGTYRVDALQDSNPIWRAFFKLTD
ncbi:MAG: serine protease [Acidobacteriia bacterium]|nr:serine protease [Terriglobia bacterium]